MALAASCDYEIARVIIFDLRKSTSKDCRFSTAAQELYNTVLLATSQNSSPNFTHLSLLVVASKGFEFLLDILPVSNAKINLKKVFGRLKQLLCYFNKENIFTKRGSFEWILSEIISKHHKAFVREKSAHLEINVITLFEEQFVLNEVETFLYQHDVSCLERLVVVQLLQSTASDQICDWEENSKGKLVVRTLVGNERQTRRFFKSWLKDKTCRWTIVMANCDKWKVTVDLEQILLNWNFGSTAATADSDRKKETIEFFNGDAGYDRCLVIFRWIRADGVSMTLVYGAPRRVLPSKYVDCTSSPEENRSEFVSLWQWLTKEKLVALARLVHHDKITDFFVLTPGDDRSLLLRRIAPREMILPLTSVLEEREMNLDVEDRGDDIVKQDHYNEVHLACVQIPHLLEFNVHQHECGIVAALDRELQDLPLPTPEVPRLQMKTPSRRK